jgi:hypothetical protein
MPKSCFFCNVVVSGGATFSYCGVCQSVLYCSKVCQKKDWKEHKKICKFLNAGDGAMQVRHPEHEGTAAWMKEGLREEERSFNDDIRQFFKLFTESTFEGSQAAARKMKKIVAREIKHNRKCLLFHSLRLLIHADSEMLLWPNSPLLVLLQSVDPNVLPGQEAGQTKQGTPLHMMAWLVDLSNLSTQVTQLILGRQLIKHGANVNAVSQPGDMTPLHFACCEKRTTHLDFIQLLLKKGADSNAQDELGLTPLMSTLPLAPGAAKFLLEWPTTNINIMDRSVVSFPTMVRRCVEELSHRVARPVNPCRAENQFLLQQWSEIEKMLVERETVDTGIAPVE